MEPLQLAYVISCGCDRNALYYIALSLCEFRTIFAAIDGLTSLDYTEFLCVSSFTGALYALSTNMKFIQLSIVQSKHF